MSARTMPPPPEVVLDYRHNQVLARADGEPFPQYAPCTECGWLIGCGDAIDTITHHSCANKARMRVEAERYEQLLALPLFTLIRVGWETSPGRVQGGIFYRVGGGLGPTYRDHTARDVLLREVQMSHMPHPDQHWGIEVLARPVSGDSELGGESGNYTSTVELGSLDLGKVER